MSRGMFDFIFPRGSEEASNLARPRGRPSDLPSLNPLFRFESGVLCTQPGTRRVKAVRALLGRAGGSRRARSVFGILSSAIHNLSVRRYICKDDSIIARSAPSNLPLVPLVCPLIRVARVAARERTRANSRGWIVPTSRGRSGRGRRARGAREASQRRALARASRARQVAKLPLSASRRETCYPSCPTNLRSILPEWRVTRGARVVLFGPPRATISCAARERRDKRAAARRGRRRRRGGDEIPEAVRGATRTRARGARGMHNSSGKPAERAARDKGHAVKSASLARVHRARRRGGRGRAKRSSAARGRCRCRSGTRAANCCALRGERFGKRLAAIGEAREAGALERSGDIKARSIRRRNRCVSRTHVRSVGLLVSRNGTAANHRR